MRLATLRVTARALVALMAAVVPVVLLADVAGAQPGYSPVVLVPVPSGSNPAATGVTSIWCPLADSCTAVGVTSSGEPFVVSQDSGSWGTPQVLTLPAGNTASSLAITCPSVGDCLVAGNEKTGSAYQPVLIEESSGTWGAPTVLALPGDAVAAGSQEAALLRPWCASAGNCELVGVYLTTSGASLLAANEVAGSWSQAKSIGTSPVGVDVLGQTSGGLAFTCVDAGDCVILSDATSLSESSRTWGSPVALDLSGLPSNASFAVSSVACPNASTCIGVGSFYFIGCGGNCRPSWLAATITESSGTWSAPEDVPLYPLSQYNAIFCASDQCVVVGEESSYNDFDPYDIPIAATWSAGTWSPAASESIPLPAGSTTPASFVNDVSCASSTSCDTVGQVESYFSGNGPASAYPYSAELEPKTLATTPGAPTEVTAAPGVSSAVITWRAPVDTGGAAITSYAVSASPGGAACTTIALSCTLSGLTNGAHYVVTVSDDNGSSSSLGTTSGSFLVGAPPSSPTGVHVTRSHQVVTVAWRTAKSPKDEPVLRSTVRATDGMRHLACATTANRCLMKGFVVGHTYRLVVISHDASGWSRPHTVRFRLR